MDNPEMSDDEFHGLYNLNTNTHVDSENRFIDFTQVTYGQTFNNGGLTYSQIARY